ncbi:MAG: hypothetical protein ACRC37_07055, partial [Lentisphaeria bacterium]
YLLRDCGGNERLLKTDRHCRSHIFLENELSIISSFEEFLSLRANYWRLDARLYDVETTVGLINLYKSLINERITKEEAKEQLKLIQPNVKFCYGAYLRGIVDNERSLLSIKSEGSENGE